MCNSNQQAAMIHIVHIDDLFINLRFKILKLVYNILSLLYQKS